MGMRTVSQKTITRGKPVSGRLFPDGKKGWIGPAVRKGKKLLRQNNYAAIISTSPPISSHRVGRELAKASSLPWLADFRDFWSMYRVEDTFGDPSLVKRGQELLHSIVTEAAAITAVNRSVVSYLGAGQVITNGYDVRRADRWQAPSTRDLFVIGVPGNLGESRVIEPLLTTLDRIRTDHPDLFARVHLLQLGQVEPNRLAGLLDQRGFAGRYTIHGLQPRDTSVDLLSSCTSFFVGLTADREQGILPQRLFDLAASGRPILAYCSPDSEIARMLNATGNGCSFTDSTEAEGLAYLVQTMRAWLDGSLVITPRPAYALPYSAAEMARKFAALLDTLV
jgi:glycosyltransferase involved in cell wall biosynthesis